jgi:PAS domain S-box-containing protein
MRGLWRFTGHSSRLTAHGCGVKMKAVGIFESIVLLLAVLLTTAAALALWPYRRRTRGWAALGMLALLLGWTLARGLFWVSESDPVQAAWWLKLSFAANIVFTGLWQTVALRYGGRILGFSWGQLLAVVAEPALTLFLILNSGSDWLLNLSPVGLRASLIDNPVEQVNYNPARLIHTIYVLVLALLYIVLFFPPRRTQSVRLYRQHGLVLLSAFGLLQLSTLLLQSSPAMTLILAATAAFVLWWGFARLRLVDLQPLVRETFLEDMQQPALVIDSLGRLVNFNAEARSVVQDRSIEENDRTNRLVGNNNISDKNIGQAVTDVFPFLVPYAQANWQIKSSDSTIELGLKQQYFALRIIALLNERAQPEGYVVTLQDISERRALELDLLQQNYQLETLLKQNAVLTHQIEVELNERSASEARYRDLFENTSELIISVDIDGNIIYANTTWLMRLGYTIPPASLFDVIAPAYRTQAQAHLAATRGERTTFRSVWQSRTGEQLEIEGSATWRFEQGQAVASRVIARDVTEQNRVSRALEENEARQRSLLNDMHDMVDVVDEQGGYIYANRAWLETLGYTSEDLKTLTVFDVFPPDSREERRRQFFGDWSSNQIPLIDRWYAKDGRILDVEGIISRSQSSSGRVSSAIGRDVTARNITKYAEIEAQARLRANTTQLQRQNHLLQSLSQLSLALLSERDLPTLLNRIGKETKKLLGSDSIFLYTLTPDGQMLQCQVAEGIGQRVGQQLARGEGISGQVWRTEQSITVEDYRQWPYHHPESNFDGKAVAVPLKINEKTFGVLGIGFYDKSRQVSNEELLLLESLGSLAAVAYNNTTLLKTSEGQNRRWEGFSQITLDLVGQLTPENLLASIVEQVTMLADAPDAALYIINPVSGLLRTMVAVGEYQYYLGQEMALGEGLSGSVWQSGKTTVIANYDRWLGRAGFMPINNNGTVIGVPLYITDPKTLAQSVQGVLIIGFGAEEPHIPRELLDLLENFSRLAAIALANAQLFATVKNQNRSLEALNDVTVGLVTQRDSKVLLHQILQHASTLVNAQHTLLNLTIGREQANTGEAVNNPTMLITVAATGLFQQLLNTTTPSNQGLVGSVWQSGQIIVVSDYDQYTKKLPAWNAGTLGTMIGLPLKGNDGSIGVIILAFDQKNHPVSPEDIQFLEQFAQLAAISLNNTQLYEQLANELNERKRAQAETMQRNNYLETLRQTTLELVNSHEIPALLDTLLRYTSNLLGENNAFACIMPDQLLRLPNQPDLQGQIRLIERGSGEFVELVANYFSSYHGFYGEVYRSKKAVYLENYSEWSKAQARQSEGDFYAILGAPLIYNNHVIGIVGAARVTADQGFSVFELEILTQFAELASLAVQNAQLYNGLQNELVERERTEQELAREKSQLEMLSRERKRLARQVELVLNSAGEGIIGLDLAGRITFANPTAAHILASNPDQLLQRPAQDILSREVVFGRGSSNSNNLGSASINTSLPGGFSMPSAQPGNTQYSETTLSRRNNSVFPAEYLNTPIIEDGRMVGAVVSFRDISARKQAEANLRETELRLQRVVSSAPLMVFVLDHQGIFLLSEGRGLVASGYAPGELVGRSIWNVYRDNHDIITAAERAYGGDAFVGEVVIAGTTFETWYTPTLNSEGQVNSVIGVSVDITERRRAEATLRSRNQFISTVLESIAALVVVIDRQGRIVEVNRAVELLLGRLTSDMIGKSFWLALAPIEKHQDSIELFRRVRATRQPFLGDGVFITADGRNLRVTGSMTPLVDGRGEVEYVLMTALDITESRQFERALRLAKEEAERANTAKSEFLSRMSHELRTPLTAILGFSDLLTMTSKDATTLEFLKDITRAGQHLLSLINEVLDVARIEAGRMELNPEALSLDVMVEDATTLVIPMAKKYNISFQVGNLENLAVVADRQRFKQVLINLLSNAVKYNRPGGQVIIRAEVLPGNTSTSASGIQSNTTQRLILNISDTGRGIGPEQLERLYTPFDRLGMEGSNIEGTGIGLALTRRLIEAMEGQIHVKSSVGVGTTFGIELPLAQLPNRASGITAALPAERINDDSALKTKESHEQFHSVLYIEDNPANLRLVERILERRNGVKLISASHGSLGLELAREHHPHLLLLDLNLPDISGAEVLAKMREHSETKDIPVVMLSADATPQQIERLLAAGARYYLTKPIDVKHFLSVVDEILSEQPFP